MCSSSVTALTQLFYVYMDICCFFTIYFFFFGLISPAGRIYSPLLLVPLAPLSNVVLCTQPSAEWGLTNSSTFLRTGEKAQWSQVEITLRARYLMVWVNEALLSIYICYTFGLRCTVDCNTSEIQEQRRTTQTMVGVVLYFTYSFKTIWYGLVRHVY